MVITGCCHPLPAGGRAEVRISAGMHEFYATKLFFFVAESPEIIALVRDVQNKTLAKFD